MITAKITQQQYEGLANKLRAELGLELVGNVGQLSKDGVTASYSFDGETLQIEVVKHPFFVPKSICETKLKDALEAGGIVARQA